MIFIRATVYVRKGTLLISDGGPYPPPVMVHTRNGIPR